MKLWIHGPPLGGRTSSIPSRGMLRELLSRREDLEVVLATEKSGRTTGEFSELLRSLPADSVETQPLPRGRYATYGAALLGLEGYCPVRCEADVYLDCDVHYFGSVAKPLVVTLADLSCLLIPKSASLTWHGRRVWKHGLELAVAHAAAIICVSETTRRDLVRFFPEARGRAITVHNGIAKKWRDPPRSERPVPGLGCDRPYWIWYGHVTARKNLGRLLHAYAELLSESRRSEVSSVPAIPDLLLVATLGHDSNDLPARVQRMGLEGRVRFLDPQPLDRLIALVDGSEGLLFPSLHEGFGLPAVEALARGKRVLCSDRGALPEVTGGYAILADAEDVDRLRAGLRRMIEERPSAAEAERRRAWAKKFTYEAAALRYAEVLRRVVAGESLAPDLTVHAARGAA